MRTAFILLASLFLLGSVAASHAQTRLKISFSAKCEFTNSTGKISRQTINTRSILNDAAGRAGVSAKALSLVYHIQGDPRGDLIQVVNNSDGSVVETVFMLFYPTLNGQFDGGFVAVTNAANTYVERPLFVFGHQSSHSVGTALIQETLPPDPEARKARYKLQGDLQYFMLPQGSTGIALCRGRVTGAKPFVPDGN